MPPTTARHRPVRRGPFGGVDDPPGARRRDAARPSRPTARWPAPPQLLGRPRLRRRLQPGRRAHRRAAGRRRRAGPRPPVRPALGADDRRGSPRLTADELDAVERFVARRRRADRARRDRAGEVRQQPQRAARPVRLHLENDTVQDYEHNARRAELDPAASSPIDVRPGEILARVARGLPVPRDDDHLDQRRPGAGAHPATRLDARRAR